MKCVEANVSQDHTLSVRYWHRGNSGRDTRTRRYNVRKGQKTTTQDIVSKYISAATIRNRSGVVLGYGESVCSPKDTPNRRLGRTIAVGRALAQVSGRHLSTGPWDM